MIVSSANSISKKLKTGVSASGWGPIVFCAAVFMTTVRTQMKRRGDKVQPCRTPSLCPFHSDSLEPIVV
eukprot:13667508-Alexandrium_andersonii.AAC.1